MKERVFFASLVLMLLAFDAKSQDLAFKGFKLGGTKEALLKQFPALSCNKPTTQALKVDEVCRVKDEYRYKRNESTKPLETYASKPVVDQFFHVIDGRVEGFFLQIASTDYDAIRDAAKALYGTGKEDERQMQNGYGAVYKSRIWNSTSVKNGTFTVAEHVVDLEYGAIVAQTSLYIRHVEQMKRGNPVDASKDM